MEDILMAANTYLAKNHEKQSKIRFCIHESKKSKKKKKKGEGGRGKIPTTLSQLKHRLP